MGDCGALNNEGVLTYRDAKACYRGVGHRIHQQQERSGPVQDGGRLSRQI